MPAVQPPPVHLSPAKGDLRSTSSRAYPLPEWKPDAVPVSGVEAIISFLDVEKSPRYKPGNGSTYCNIYAYDFFHAYGVYLPRVWWVQSLLSKSPWDPATSVAYAKTVRELSANALYGWLVDYGPTYGWTPVKDLNALQAEVNQGSIGVICAAQKDPTRSGHITCVVPETAEYKALRDASGNVLAPAQSQAGATNKAHFAKDWWKQAKYRVFDFWTNKRR